MRTKQVAHEVGVSRDTVYRAIAAGELEALRLGPAGCLRVPRDAVDRWLRPVQHPSSSPTASTSGRGLAAPRPPFHSREVER